MSAPRPTFVGIGTVRGGSTWLHDLLDQHPDVWLPTAKRKELVYFDRLHHKGDDWYRRQFAAAPADALAVGEISPTYLASPGAAERMRASLPHLDRLVVMLRDPARRAWSEYQWRIRHDHLRDSVEQFLVEGGQFDQGSRYSRTLPEFLRHFPEESILMVVSEEAFADPVAARERVAAFLGIDPQRFPAEAGLERSNEGGLPRFPRLYSMASRVRRRLRWWDLDVIPNLANRLGLRKALIGEGAPPPEPSAEELVWLQRRYADDVRWVERHLGRRIDAWSHVE